MELPADFSVHLVRLLEAGRCEAARVECEAVLGFSLSAPDRARVTLFLAEALAGTGQARLARSALDDSLELDRDDPVLRLQAAELLAGALASPTEARAQARTAIRLEVGRNHVTHDGHQLLARLALLRGSTLEAEEHLLESANLDRPPPYPYMIRTDVFLALSSVETATLACARFFRSIQELLASAALMYVADDERFFATGRALPVT